MNRCRHPEHPHCTVWVMPAESSCAHGHAQPAAAALPPELAPELLPELALDHAPAPGAAPLVPAALPVERAHLHVSGFDPRAAGGRQLLKLELRGMPADCPAELTLLAASRLRLDGGGQHSFVRTARGEWLPVFLEFSSRGLEHGQYRIELELYSRPAGRTWGATLLVLAPRPDAGLHEIHQTFLATHKNVRVSATDASIARVRARVGGGSVDVDVQADNAGIAHLDLDAGAGKIDLGLASIAWDEELLELDQPQALLQGLPRAAPAPAEPHPCPASSACLVFETAAYAPGSARPVRHLRLFALDECVLGRFEPGARGADLLLMHWRAGEPERDGLTRRISARHALIRRGREGYEIEDVSRYGLLADGAWPGKHAPLLLRTGMRIELTASIPGVVLLEVGELLPNGIILRRLDAGMDDEAFCLLDPECDPGDTGRLHAPALPLLFHRNGGFWQREHAGAAATPLTPARLPAAPPGWPRLLQFVAQAYPDHRADHRAHHPANRLEDQCIEQRTDKRADRRVAMRTPAAAAASTQRLNAGQSRLPPPAR